MDVGQMEGIERRRREGQLCKLLVQQVKFASLLKIVINHEC